MRKALHITRQLSYPIVHFGRVGVLKATYLYLWRGFTERTITWPYILAVACETVRWYTSFQDMGLFDQADEIVSDDPVEKNRLFETLKETNESSRNYLKLFSIVAVCVLIAGAALYYLLMPGIGDQIRAPAGLEDRVRSHFQQIEKRTATDITFFKCEGYTWARVDVEERPDIHTNPVYKYSRYRAKISGLEGNWQISALPETSRNEDVPCNF